MPMKNTFEKQDVYEVLTNRIIEALESGTRPWVRPWDSSLGDGLPINAVTGKPYSGVNMLSGMYEMFKAKSEDPRFCTFSQAKANGWHIKPGSKGIPMVKWVDARESNKKKDESKGDDEGIEKENLKEDKPYFFPCKFTVFHASCIDGIPPLEKKEVVEKEPGVLEKEIDSLVKAVGVKRHVDNKAYYIMSEDSIGIPPIAAFKSEGHYVSTLSHELCHATGHPDRLKRDMRGGFGSHLYAQEELRAELGSVFLAAKNGWSLSAEIFDNNAAYVESWIKALKNDKKEIFKASSDSQKIVAFISEKKEISLKKEENISVMNTTQYITQKEKAINF